MVHRGVFLHLVKIVLVVGVAGYMAYTSFPELTALLPFRETLVTDRMAIREHLALHSRDNRQSVLRWHAPAQTRLGNCVPLDVTTVDGKSRQATIKRRFFIVHGGSVRLEVTERIYTLPPVVSPHIQQIAAN